MTSNKVVFDMTEEKLEEFIIDLDLSSTKMCVNPDNQTFDCCDCYTCRVSYFDYVRRDIRDKFTINKEDKQCTE